MELIKIKKFSSVKDFSVIDDYLLINTDTEFFAFQEGETQRIDEAVFSFFTFKKFLFAQKQNNGKIQLYTLGLLKILSSIEGSYNLWKKQQSETELIIYGRKNGKQALFRFNENTLSLREINLPVGRVIGLIKDTVLIYKSSLNQILAIDTDKHDLKSKVFLDELSIKLGKQFFENRKGLKVYSFEKNLILFYPNINTIFIIDIDSGKVRDKLKESVLITIDKTTGSIFTLNANSTKCRVFNCSNLRVINEFPIWETDQMIDIRYMYYYSDFLIAPSIDNKIYFLSKEESKIIHSLVFENTNNSVMKRIKIHCNGFHFYFWNSQNSCLNVYKIER